MKRILITLVITVSCFTNLHAQSTAHERCQRIDNGISLSSWLEAYWLDYIPGQPWPVPDFFKKSDLVFMKEMGFTSVRFPISFERFTDTVAPYTMHTEMLPFALIDSVITWTQDLEMVLIIDNHHGWPLVDSTCIQQIPRLTSIWMDIVERYDYISPDELYFELKNEPEGTISQENLQIVFGAIIDSIRTINQTHTIVVGSTMWNSGYTLAGSQTYNDDNLIYTFHYYEPFPFTHQGFLWSWTPGSGVTFPSSPEDETNLRDLFILVDQWAKSNGVPVFLGEFGPGIHGDIDSRCNWVSLIGHLCDSLQMPYVYWDWEYDFSMFKSRVMCQDSIYPCFVEALGLGDISTSAYNFDHKKNITSYLYPNPSSDYIEVHSDARIITYHIFNSNGILIHSSKKKYIDTSDFQSGIYYLKLITDEGIYNLSFIKV